MRLKLNLRKFWREARCFTFVVLFAKENLGWFVTRQQKSIRFGLGKIIITIFNYDYETYCEGYKGLKDFKNYFDKMPKRLERYIHK